MYYIYMIQRMGDSKKYTYVHNVSGFGLSFYENNTELLNSKRKHL